MDQLHLFLLLDLVSHWNQVNLWHQILHPVPYYQCLLGALVFLYCPCYQLVQYFLLVRRNRLIQYLLCFP